MMHVFDDRLALHCSIVKLAREHRSGSNPGATRTVATPQTLAVSYVR